jgi:holo-[acyl-carrier protein] synthase
MIVGIGIDMIEVDRVRTKIQKEKGFREHIFSDDEITYCMEQPEPYQHFAARFAGKEAFLKAIGRGLSFSLEVDKIEILPTENGKPEIHLKGEYESLAEEGAWKKIHVSLTHLASIASAVVIIEK